MSLMGEAADSRAPVSPADRWLVLAGALMVQLILGTVYGFSVLIKPLQAQFPEWSNTDIQLAFTLTLVFFAAVMVPAGRLQDMVGPRIPTLLGAAALCLGSLMASTVRDPSQKFQFWMSYGVIAGTGIGLAYVCPIAALTKWFPDIKGLITGIAVAGFGGGAMIFIPTVSRFLGPNAQPVHEFFLIHAIASGVIVIVGALLLRNPPPGWAPPRRELPAGAPPRPTPAAPVEQADWPQVLRTPRFWQLWLMFAGAAAAGLMTIGVVKDAVAEQPMIAASQAALAGSILSIFNALGRVAWGGVSDRLGRERSMALMFGIQTVTMFLVPWAIAQGAVMAYVIMALIGLNFGGNFAVFPSATADRFGTKHMGVNYGLVFTAYGVAGVVGPMIAAYFKDTVGAYAPAFMVAGVLVGLATGLAVISMIGKRREG